MQKKTKIVATLGPATDKPSVLENLLLNGVNTVRLNFSHGSADDHRDRAKMVRKLGQKLNLTIAIMGDLQGPKIRIAKFKNQQIKLASGDIFILNTELDQAAGDTTQVGVDYKNLPNDCNCGDILLLDDGRIQLSVLSISNSIIKTQVKIGGILSNNKGINLQGGGLSATALTTKDRDDIKLAAEIDIDYIAVSFPRTAADIYEAKNLLKLAGSQAEVIAKIERAEAVTDSQTLDNIILASDGVMVARGDLGVEIGDAALISVQKHLIQRARELNRFIITATQMMESMIISPMPTRAEVFDIANAILDGTDAVMLSAETAAGEHPVAAVTAMSSICQGAEKHQFNQSTPYWKPNKLERIDETIARSAIYTASHLTGVKAIICLTESGSTPLWMSRVHTELPIFAVTRHKRTMRRMALYRGVESIFFDATIIEPNSLNDALLLHLKKIKILNSDDLIILTRGAKIGNHGGTNSLKVLSVP